MVRLVFKVVVLVMLVIGLTPSPAKSVSLADSVPAATSCDFESCNNKCVKLGYLGGTCGSITHACVCYSIYPPPDQKQ